MATFPWDANMNNIYMQFYCSFAHRHKHTKHSCRNLRCKVTQNSKYVTLSSRKPHRALFKRGSTLVTLPRIVTPYRDSVDGTRARVTFQKLVTR